MSTINAARNSARTALRMIALSVVVIRLPMPDDDNDLGEVPMDPLLGQPRMVGDPRISIAQGAAALGKTVAQVHRLVKVGRLPRHGPANNGRPLLLSEVEALRDKGEPVPVTVAARILRRSLESVLELVAGGQLPMVPGTKARVYQADVDAIVATAKKVRSAKKAAKRARTRRPQVGPPGYLNSRQTAEKLGITAIGVTQMAADERIPAVFKNGRWWFDPERVEMICRARQARKDRTIRPDSSG
jgi:hypothetical protein